MTILQAFKKDTPELISDNSGFAFTGGTGSMNSETRRSRDWYKNTGAIRRWSPGRPKWDT